ncbi:MAG: 23S rRNA (adenine(2503)-C(2))-methyltransferase RlmN [Lentisphaerae bacterium]|nr:23S rRNA (adenine(2503)-C(2))-methyltransferase RlmN [Lentisphaerota bacterium]
MNDARFYLPGISGNELKEYLQSIGEKPFRARQILDWLYGKCEFNVDKMLNLPGSLRTCLAGDKVSLNSRVVEAVPGSGSTEKLLIELDDKEVIEMVLIPSPERMTFCLSTQVGCPVRCRFCASGAHGLIRNLRTDEILEEFYHGVQKHGSIPDNIVFMGIGEGLLNWKNLRRALEVLSAPTPEGFNMSPRRITVSSSGYVPGMKEFAAWGRPFNLAISLHAVDDETRSKLIPDNVRYSIKEILQACAECSESTGRMILFEYTLVDGINDDPAMGRELGRIAARLHAKVNLIACNPVNDEFKRPSEKRLKAFYNAVSENAATVTMRMEKGSSAASACGQLRLRRQNEI